MEAAIQIFAVVNLAVIGISHIVRPGAWVVFFEWLKGKGEAGVFATAFLSLGFGSIIVAFHNVWSGIPMVLTLLGWAQILKALVYFTWPSYGLKKLQLVSEKRGILFIIPGIAFVVVAALLLYNLLSQS